MANEIVLNPKKELIEKVAGNLEAMLKEKMGAFPEGFNQTRFLQNCLAVLADTKDIEKCSAISVVRCLIKGAFLNLDFFRKECYVIVYNENVGTKDAPKWIKSAQFQTDVKGEVKLAKKYGKNIKDVYAKIVREGDVLEVGVDRGLQYVNFAPKAFNDAAIQGVFAVVYLNDGSMRVETMSVKDVNDVRQGYSKSADGPSWIKSWAEMAKAKVVRRACKTVDLHFENQEQQRAYEEGSGDDLNKPVSETPKVKDPFKETNSIEHQVEDAQVVEAEKSEDPDAELVAALMKKHPGELEWQARARIKESRGEA